MRQPDCSDRTSRNKGDPHRLQNPWGRRPASDGNAYGRTVQGLQRREGKTRKTSHELQVSTTTGLAREDPEAPALDSIFAVITGALLATAALAWFLEEKPLRKTIDSSGLRVLDRSAA